MTIINKQVSFEDILTHCEIGKKAIEVINCFKMFLQTQEDREKFIELYESRFVWKQRNPVFEAQRLAKEIGSYHYTYSSFDDLLKMNLRDALQHLFLQPINVGMEYRYIESKATLKDMYDLKQANPSLLLMNAI